MLPGVISQALNMLAAEAPPAGGTHRYWKITGITIGGNSYLEVSQIELYEADQLSTNAGVTLSSSDAPTESLNNLKDLNLNTRCYWAEAVAEGAGFYIQFDFGVGNEKQVVYLRQARFDNALRFMTSLSLSYSDNGSDWTLQSSKTGLTNAPTNKTWAGYVDVSS